VIRYRREIDGLRAIAVLPVILFHAGFALFSGGFAGVDVFFVISGYLITSVIVTERQAGTFSLVRFYERRARRILPALFVVMFACLPIAWWLMLPADMKLFARSLTSTSLFASNMLFSKQSGYFDTAAALKPLLHTWSLGIEEQYYLLFPVFLLVAWKFGWRRITGMLVIIAAISLALSQWQTAHDPAKAFYSLSARVWELLIGALAAFALIEKERELTARPWLCQLLALAGLALIAFAVFTFDAATPFPGLHALIPTLGTALIILFATPATLTGRLLSTRPLVGVGLISYSAYLWHHPLFAFTRIGGIETPSAALLIGLSIASLLLAFVSWKYVERPFRNPAFIRRKPLFIGALIGSLFFILLGVTGSATKGFEKYFLAHRLDDAEKDIYALIKKNTGGDMTPDMGDDGDCNFWVKAVDAAFTQRFAACQQKYGKAVIVLGDSHGMNIYNALYRAGFARFLAGVAQPACRPYDPSLLCPYQDFKRFLAEHKTAVDLVIFHESGSHLLLDDAGREDSPDIFDPAKQYSIHHGNIEMTADYLAELGQSAKILWLGPFAEARFDFRNLRKIKKDGFTISPHTLAIFAQLDEEMKRSLTSYKKQFAYRSLVDILQVTPDFLRQGDCITYRDADHLSVCGEAIAGAKIKAALAR